MNLKEIKELIKIIDASGLSELHIESDDVKLTLKKEITIRQVRDEAASDVIAREIKPEVRTAVEEKKEDENIHVIKSPIVGIFYSSPNPESPTYVKAGDMVKTGDVLCIIEAMKLMNEITSDVSGEVVEVVLSNQSPVEYGQPLFKIRKV